MSGKETKKKVCFFASLILLAILLAGCGNSSSREGPGKTSPVAQADKTNQQLKVNLVVTRDFGRQEIFEQSVFYRPGATILNILEANLSVETAYGGSFINAINGLKSNAALNGERQDWFYYVNGIACEVGVLDYDPRQAGTIWWDYHPWQSGPANAAVIGCFPEPFVHGYRGRIKATLLMSSTNDYHMAKALAETMETKGVSRIDIVKPDDKKLNNREQPVIISGSWDELQKIKYIRDFNHDYKRNASGIHFTGKGIELLNFNGEVIKKLDSAGVIIASGQGLGDGSPLWLITGTDKIAWRNSMDVLINHPEKIRHLYGAAVVGEELIPLPVQ